MFYNRQIIYLDLIESGSRIKNAGFWKVETTDEEIRWQIQVRGLYETDNGFYDLRDEEGGLVDKILLKRGSGSYTRAFDIRAVSRGGRQMKDICGLSVGLTGGRRLEGLGGRVRGPASSFPESREEKEVLKAAGNPAGTVKERKENKENRENREIVIPAMFLKRRKEPEPPAGAEGPEADISSAAIPPATGPETAGSEKRKNPEELCVSSRSEDRPESGSEREMKSKVERPGEYYEDKWEQLCHTYPVVHPFGDEREYLSVTPAEFVVLRQEYHAMVHNSFLLHGFYNYRHVILGKIRAAGGENYYLGVPGVYYEREKAAAEMFGFEAFEGKQSPAEPGTFGYYMKRVEI